MKRVKCPAAKRGAGAAIVALTVVLSLFVASPIHAQDPAHPETALADYVAKPDPSFSWEVHARSRHLGADFLELTLHSQTWRGTVWKHQLVLIKPRHISSPRQGVLIIGGGRWRDEYEANLGESDLPDGAARFALIARRLDAVVAVVGQVPFQPLLGLTEDRLIAYTFDQYLKTGDPEWPLLLPMVKSAVRAMDAATAAAHDEWGLPLENYTVLGGSKRGWTAWLTAAIDSRVNAVAPTVIDALNMERHFPYQTEAWGEPSPEIAPYTALHLDQVLGSDAGAALRQIVDPYSYRAVLTQPKLVVIATNDHYFPVDSANLYWDGLADPKYLLYLPNDQHSIRDYPRLLDTFRRLHEWAAGGPPMPRFEWEYRWQDDAATLCVRGEPAPREVRLWTATSPTRDFREAVWSVGTELRGGDANVFDVEPPASGYSAVFAEAKFDRGRSAYTLSTNLAMLAAPGVTDLGPRPVGHEGVCGAPGR